MARYYIEPRPRKYPEGYVFLSFVGNPTNMGNNYWIPLQKQD